MRILILIYLSLLTLTTGQFSSKENKEFGNLKSLKTLVLVFGSNEFIEKYLDNEQFIISLPINKVIDEFLNSPGQPVRTLETSFLTFVQSGKKKVTKYGNDTWSISAQGYS